MIILIYQLWIISIYLNLVVHLVHIYLSQSWVWRPWLAENRAFSCLIQVRGRPNADIKSKRTGKVVKPDKSEPFLLLRCTEMSKKWWQYTPTWRRRIPHLSAPEFHSFYRGLILEKFHKWRYGQFCTLSAVNEEEAVRNGFVNQIYKSSHRVRFEWDHHQNLFRILCRFDPSNVPSRLKKYAYKFDCLN